MARKTKASADTATTAGGTDSVVQEAAAPEPAPAPEMASPAFTAPAGNSSGRRGLFSRMYGDVGEMSAADRDRVAAQEWQAAVAPVMDMLRESVPGASSAEEAAQAWQSTEPVIPDPDGGAYIYGDAFENDARVYYRILRRDYEDNPRPGTGDHQPYYIGNLAKKHHKSHYLPSSYGQRPGIKGW